MHCHNQGLVTRNDTQRTCSRKGESPGPERWRDKLGWLILDTPECPHPLYWHRTSCGSKGKNKGSLPDATN